MELTHGGTAVTKTVTITATDVNEAPTVVRWSLLVGDVTELEDVVEYLRTTQSMNVEVARRRRHRIRLCWAPTTKTDFDVGDGTVDTTADASQVKLSLSGDDAAVFELSDPIPAGETNPGARELRFKASPNFESPVSIEPGQRLQGDHVVATDKKGLTGTQRTDHHGDQRGRGR